MTEHPDLSTLSFEQALQRLEEIVEELSSSELDVENLVSRYEEGVHYLELCSSKLNDAEARLRILNEKFPSLAEEN
ncbi:MAG TPA: exodeoxyribonuclease VII small subunit [Candidatus Cloacimonadota bacterium]|jgi:exodeoxyribonuclease VII small subunit|nr:exodeoxyribonuclease VII small subunit [Candidatus Cloacimonadota bacterium]